MAAVSSREFIEWVAFDKFEPIGSRTTADLLALLVAMFHNVNRVDGVAPWMMQDVLDSPLYPRRLDPREQAIRVGQVMADYRRLRAERLARQAQEAEQSPVG